MESDVPAAALAELAAVLGSGEVRYVIGGSTGLALRGAELGRPPRDVDVYVDEEDVGPVHRLLRRYATDSPRSSVTDIYRSTLSHYSVAGAWVELVGGFRVTARQSEYRTEVREVLHPACDRMDHNGISLPVVPLGHELVFNLLRDRPDRADVAGRLISENPGRHVPQLRTIIARNRLAPEVAELALKLSGTGGLPAEREERA
ncbi:hypothetical protein [Cohnella hongkongensis]|uniref:Uncharacterized protein n=1 Tax=Cohnella hongkongensis TaxID=178337 RepID=A0ABV9FE83_9BACL